MRTAAFMEFVRYIVFIQIIFKSQVYIIQKVLRTAGMEDLRHLRHICFLYVPDQMLHTVLAFHYGIQVPEQRIIKVIISPGILKSRLCFVNFMDNIGRRHGNDFGKGIRISKTIPQCAISSHGNSADKGILPLIGKPESLSCKINKINTDIVPETAACPRPVCIEGIFTVRQYHCQIEAIRHKTYVSAQKPFRAGIAVTIYR